MKFYLQLRLIASRILNKVLMARTVLNIFLDISYFFPVVGLIASSVGSGVGRIFKVVLHLSLRVGIFFKVTIRAPESAFFN